MSNDSYLSLILTFIFGKHTARISIQLYMRLWWCLYLHVIVLIKQGKYDQNIYLQYKRKHFYLMIISRDSVLPKTKSSQSHGILYNLLLYDVKTNYATILPGHRSGKVC